MIHGIEKVHSILSRYREIEAMMASPEIASNHEEIEKLGREYRLLGKNMPLLREYASVVEKISQAHELLENESDHEFREMAREEIEKLEKCVPALEERVKYALVPRNPNDLKNAIVEIRAGTGGLEAGMFAADLYRMYTRYVESKHWGIEIMNSSYGDLGAIKEIVFIVNGNPAYGMLKFESGVHRVQRVPQTESQGRIHTSAASVAVFPEADDVEIDLNPADLRIDVFRSSGPGGQSVNTTDSAVRVVHIPTGLTVSCQDEKSQHKNKAKALKVLKSRLYEKKLAEKEESESANRRSMVGSGDRSVKIRTYNFPQNRVTDHRINLTLYKLDQVLDGALDELADALSLADLNERLKLSTKK